MWAIILIIAGLVLGHNPGWFAGAAAVGAFCFWAGVIILVLWVVFTILALIAAGSR